MQVLNTLHKKSQEKILAFIFDKTVVSFPLPVRSSLQFLPAISNQANH